MKTATLHKVAPAQPARLSFQPNDIVWQLNLEQIESHTGRILIKIVGPASTTGSSTHAFDEGNVLYSKLRPYLNKVVCPESPGIATTELVPLRPDPKQLDRRYLTHYLRSPQFVRWVSNEIAGAKMPRVTMKVFWNHSIPLPPIAEQKRIAAILDAADALRAKRRESLAQLDTLLQSTFLDIFGDPVTNPKRFPIKNLPEFYINKKEGTKCGPFGSTLKKDELVEYGIPVWNMDNIDSSGRMSLPFRMWITEEKFRELQPYSVVDGDVIISRAGTVGKMCVANTKNRTSIISTNLIRVRFGPNLLPIYFVSLMTYCRGRVGRF